MRFNIAPLLLGLIALVMMVVVVIVPAAPLPASYAQAGATTPPTVYETAISALNAAIPGIGRPDSWRHEVPGNSNQVGLGCPTAPTTALGRTVGVFTIWLRYGEVEYLYYVASDGSAVVPCDPKIPAVPGATDANGNAVTGVQSTCRIDATVANVRSTPDSTSDSNIITELRNGSAAGIGRTGDNAWYQVSLVDGTIGWIAAVASTAVGNCATLPITAASATEFGSCPVGFAPDYLIPRITAGDLARIEPGGSPNVVRQQPSRTAQRLGLMQPGTRIAVLGGPVCGGNYVWWQVTNGTLTGWTVESYALDNDYYIDLIQRGGGGTITNAVVAPTPTVVAATKDDLAVVATGEIISAANISRLTVINTLNAPTSFRVAYSPDGRYLVTFSTTGVQVYSFPDYQLVSNLSTLLTPTDPTIITTAAAFSADGRYLVLGYNLGTLWTVELATGTVFRLSPELQTSINVIRFDANNRVVVGTGSLNGGAQAQLNVYDFARMNATNGDLPRLMTVFVEDGPVFDALILAEPNAVAYVGVDFLEVRDINSSRILLRQALVQRGASRVMLADGFATFSDLLTLTSVGNSSVLLGWDLGDAVTQSITTITAQAGVDSILTLPQGDNVAPLLLVGVDAIGTGEFRAYSSSPIQPIFTTPTRAWDSALSADGRHIAIASGDGQTGGIQILAVR